MSRLPKPFDELFMKVIAVAASDNRDVSLQFPALYLQAGYPAATTPLEQLMERPRDPLADTDRNRWRHGGINE